MIVVALAVFAITGLVVFVMMEERGRPEIAVLLILVLVVFDALVYESSGSVPPGVLHPTIMGHDYRIPDLIIPLALLARLFVRGLPRRITGAGLLWFGFFALFLAAAPLGLANGHTSVLVIFQTKFVLEGGGMAILVAGVSPQRMTAPRFVAGATWFLGLMSIGPILLGAANHQVGFPGLPDSTLGVLGADAATVLMSFGFLLLLVEVCGPSPRFGVVAWCGLLIVTPIFTGQRAAAVGLVATLVCAVVVMSGRQWRRRSRTRLTQLVPIICLLVIPIGVAAIAATSSTSTNTTIPVVGELEGRFTGTAKTQSANIRLTVWDLGRHLIAERPALGWGLGQDFNIFQQNGSEDPFTGGDFHNIVIDVSVTTGLVGLSLFVLAFGTSLWGSIMSWRRIRDNAIAAYALAGGILMIQLAAKGLFESVFQKYRLALVFGLFIGMIAAVERMRADDAADDEVTETVIDIHGRTEPVWT